MSHVKLMAPLTAPLSRVLQRVAAALLPFAWVVVARHLDVVYITQLERYNSPRLWGWISRHWGVVLDGRAAILQGAVLVAGIVLSYLHLPAMTFYIAWVAAGMWLWARRSSLQVSQRLQFTPRAPSLSASALPPGLPSCPRLRRDRSSWPT